MDTNTFRYRILLLDDDPLLRSVGKQMLELHDYEVLCVNDGFEGLAALKQSLPDLIITDLELPNMDGFEFLSVIRRRFPILPVIVISGRFYGMSVPNNVLADAFFPKGSYQMDELFDKISELLNELPTRPRTGKTPRAAIWVKNDKGTIAVSCPECLRTFPIPKIAPGDHKAECAFCGSTVHFELIRDHKFERIGGALSLAG